MYSVKNKNSLIHQTSYFFGKSDDNKNISNNLPKMYAKKLLFNSL